MLVFYYFIPMLIILLSLFIVAKSSSLCKSLNIRHSDTLVGYGCWAFVPAANSVFAFISIIFWIIYVYVGIASWLFKLKDK